MTIDPFFVVWNPAHGVPPTSHADHGNARAEAARLALENPGEEIFVLAATDVARRTEPVVWVEVDPVLNRGAR